MGQRMMSSVVYVAVSVVVEERQGRRCRGQTADDSDAWRRVERFLHTTSSTPRHPVKYSKGHRMVNLFGNIVSRISQDLDANSASSLSS